MGCRANGRRKPDNIRQIEHSRKGMTSPTNRQNRKAPQRDKWSPPTIPQALTKSKNERKKQAWLLSIRTKSIKLTFYLAKKCQNACIYAKIVVPLHANLHLKEEKLSNDELKN